MKRIDWYDYIHDVIICLERMHVRELFVVKMNYVMIIGFITHVSVNLHSLVNDVIKVIFDFCLTFLVY